MEEEKDESHSRKDYGHLQCIADYSEQLLTGKGIEDEEEIATAMPESRFTPQDIRMIEDYHALREEQQKRLLAYMEALKKIESLEEM